MNEKIVIITLFAALLIAPSNSMPRKARASGEIDSFEIPHSNARRDKGLPAFDNPRASSGEAKLNEERSAHHHSPDHTAVIKMWQPKSNPNKRNSEANTVTTREKNGTSTVIIPEASSDVPANKTTDTNFGKSQEFLLGNDAPQEEEEVERNIEGGHHFMATHNREQSLDIEEQKLMAATNKLVKWLRNRLRKRLSDVADLESEITTENELLKNLSEEIQDASRDREDEIKQKLRTKKELSDFRRHSNPPDAGVNRVRSQTKALSEQLERLKDAYESMTMRHKDLENKLRSAGFSHWLEARGRDYFPDTAIGVLSKSAQVLGPVSHGFQRALLFDDRLSTEMEQIVPGSDETIFGKIVWDITMMVPFIPFLLLLRLASGMLRSLSVYDIVLCGSGLFAAESVLCFVMSAFFGREVLGICQEVNESILVALLFVNSSAFFILFLAQILISCLRPSRAEAVQAILLFTVGCRYYQYVFRPVMLSKPVMVTILSHILYIITFSLILVEKKRVMNFKTPYDQYFQKLMMAIEAWVFDTGHAMRNVFSDIVPYGSRTYTEIGFGSRSSFYASVSNCDINSEAHERMSTDEIEALECKPPPHGPQNTEYLGQNRWYPVNRSASLIRKTFTASLEYGDRINLAPPGLNTMGRAQKKFRSNSDDSLVYQSCME
ncbi:unnamed protein product [Agarophyton chilense]|eukprot:gb/GEZJ01002827.1/.p1 GENE.gb/GEZJ01002827.1/~~gb/GEZJ01002827.1/.p1  ORF type:complete len:665 (-),score=98.25 gb/GEZJ01002827.1/:1213-3207(-)